MRDIHNYLLVVCFPLNCLVSESVGFSFFIADCIRAWSGLSTTSETGDGVILTHSHTPLKNSRDVTPSSLHQRLKKTNLVANDDIYVCGVLYNSSRLHPSRQCIMCLV